MSDTTTASAESAVRPFRIEVPQGEIDELRRRINATRWPTRELVTDRSLVTTYGRRSRAALQIGHYERVLPMLVEPARWLTMPCSMCVAAMVRLRIESSDLAPRSRGCRGLLRVRRHDRDGSRVFVASVELPGPVWARRPP